MASCAASSFCWVVYLGNACDSDSREERLFHFGTKRLRLPIESCSWRNHSRDALVLGGSYTNVGLESS